MSALPGPYEFTNSVTASRYRMAGECCLLSHQYISRVEVEKTHKAICFANYLGYRLNVELTLSWVKMGFRTFTEIDGAQRGFEELLRKKITGYGVPFFAYTVFENGLIHSCHAHMGLFIPSFHREDFEIWLTRCLKRIARTYDPDACKLEGYRTDPTTSQWKWFAYLMKGLDPRLTKDEEAMFPGMYRTPHWLFGVKYYRYSGFVPFQRVRRSKAMECGAQRKANYSPQVDLYKNDTNARYSDAEYLRGRRDRAIAEVKAALGSMELI